MKLFNDIELFVADSRVTKEFNLPDADVIPVDHFFTKEEYDNFCDKLLTATLWGEYEMPMYDKIVKAARMISWYQNKEDCIPSGNAPEFTADLNKIRERVEIHRPT